MIIKIIGLVIGLLILGTGIYYLIKERNDDESRKIYTITGIIGAVIAVVSVILLII